jgi:Tfp pilus assembly protein PilF
MAMQPTASAPQPFLRLRVCLSLPLLLQLVAVFVPGPALWGVGHLAYLPLPAWLVVLWPLGWLVAMWSPAGPGLGGWLVRKVERGLLLGRPWLVYGLVPVLGAGLGWLVRDRIHLLGDGVLISTLLAKGQPFHGFDALGYSFQAWLAGLAQATTFTAARELAAVVSTVTGASYLAAAAWAARRLGREPGEALLLYLLLVVAAPLQVFLGYVECYAQLVVCLLMFAVALLRYQRGDGGVTAPAVWLAVALIWHTTALLGVPLLAMAVLWPPPGPPERIGRRAWLAAWPVLVALGLAAAISAVSGQGNTMLAAMFERESGRHLLNAWAGPRGLGDWRHWKDLANLVLLGAPVSAALLVASGPWRRVAAERFPIEARLAVGAIWLLMAAAFIHLKLGMVRDWDLLAGPMVLAAVAAFAAWTARVASPRPVVPIVGLVAMAALGGALPWFAVNGVTTAALRRLPAVTADLPGYPHAMALVDLGRWYRENRDLDGAREAYRAAAEASPGHTSVQLLYGQVLFHRGEHEAALAPLQRAYALDPGNGLALKMLVLTYSLLDRPAETLAAARKLAGRPEEDADIAGLHGVLAEKAGEADEACEAYLRAVQLDPSRLDMLQRLGSLELNRHRGPQAEYVFRQILARTPADQTARLGLATALRLQTVRDAAALGR